ncbi:Rhs element Vgr family protein [Plesiocystis pacifica SIR-1]|uniref:Rhs element Vgr family protein n=1 Tax=Plesiocystis pacifica SIR-1 TaxID=391625 RepID=A6GJN4_9BACT|nr:type VI secretion system tip protein TssI/VgrG [Plesiocystis pacifica]EDM73919.1 Rhs element Vgr family protein [Plesiocystis pacifica SIR-1]
MSDERLDLVTYSFSVLDEIDPDWRVRRMRLFEAISEPYELVVELASEGLGADSETDLLLGRSVELVIHRGGLLRSVCGVVRRVDDLGVSEGFLSVVAYVVPALSLLGQRIDTRIFQGMTVPEIVDEVLGAGLGEYEREIDVSTGLSGQYEARDVCIQFRESDLDFCNRLLQEEGIAYVFEADEDTGRERVQLIDANESFPTLALGVGDEVEIIPDNPENAERESLQFFELVQRERTTKVTTRAYNFKNPTNVDEHEQGEADERGRTRELYHHQDRRQIVDDPIGDPDAMRFTGEDLDQREPLSVRRLELERRDVKVLLGESNLSGAQAGMRFFLGAHHRDELSHLEYLITRVNHDGEGDEVEGARADAHRYVNSVECVPFETPYRPAIHTPKPRIFGAQTATVMGPADDDQEDIHTDPHGRVKVRFHWDRLSPEDGTASCWVRCAQMWAGAGWGSMFIPRVGMEVVVTFLDGNPDRPLIVGCVYNGDQTPPYPLPDEKTKSTIKSDSSPGGGGFNEFRFEDAKGSEEVFLHAQKDFNETVLNNHSTTVSANQTNTVSGDQSESISGKQTMSVQKNRIVTITGSQSVNIEGSEPEAGVSGSKLNITGDYELDTSNTIAIQAPTEIKLTCGGSTLTMVPGKITLSAGGEATLVLDANALMQSAAGSKVLLDANVKAESSGSSVVTLDATVDAQSSGGSKLKLDANVSTESSGGSKLVLDGNALMEGVGTATVQSPSSKLAGDAGTVEATAGGVTVDGPSVDVTGSGTVTVTGGMVKIN